MKNNRTDYIPPVVAADGINSSGHSGQRLTFENMQKFIDSEVQKTFNEHVDVEAIATKHRDDYKLKSDSVVSFGPNFVLSPVGLGYAIDTFIDFTTPDGTIIETSSTMSGEDMAKFIKKQ